MTYLADLTDLLRRARLLLIWGLWSTAWVLMALGQAVDHRLMEWGLFIGLGAATVVLWHLLERCRDRGQVDLDELVAAVIRAEQKRRGPRAVD